MDATTVRTRVDHRDGRPAEAAWTTANRSARRIALEPIQVPAPGRPSLSWRLRH